MSPAAEKWKESVVSHLLSARAARRGLQVDNLARPRQKVSKPARSTMRWTASGSSSYHSRAPVFPYPRMVWEPSCKQKTTIAGQHSKCSFEKIDMACMQVCQIQANTGCRCACSKIRVLCQRVWVFQNRCGMYASLTDSDNFWVPVCVVEFSV